LGKISLNLSIRCQFLRLRRTISLDTQSLREQMISELKGIFEKASAIAKGKVKTHIVDGKPVRYTLRQRERWARVAGYMAQIIDSIARNFDEHDIDLMLAEAERLIREAGQMEENQGVKPETSNEEGSAEPNTNPEGSG
jgi:hypothetical protein